MPLLLRRLQIASGPRRPPKTGPCFCDELLERWARPVGDVEAQLRGSLLEQLDVALADWYVVTLERFCQIIAVVAKERAHAVGVA